MKTIFNTFLILCTLLTIGVLVARSDPPPTDPFVYTVQWGDTLPSIARRHATTTAAIVRLNDLVNPDRVYVGQRLMVPAREMSLSSPTAIYVVRQGDSLNSIAHRFQTTVNAIAQANRIYNPCFTYAGQRLLIPLGDRPPESPAGGEIHVVRRGEILARIAVRYETTVPAIVVANNLPHPSLIYAGQKLIIPVAPVSAGSVYRPRSKWIDINLTTQTLVAYEGNQPMYWALVSTGSAEHPTVTGRFRIWGKYRYRDLRGGSPERGDHYYYPSVPYVMFFYRDYAMHTTYWHDDFGHPVSHGCVNLRRKDAEWLFNWTDPPLPEGQNAVHLADSESGTLVVIHE